MYKFTEPGINAEGVRVYPFDPSFPVDVSFQKASGPRLVRFNRHEFFEIIYVYSGKSEIQVRDRILSTKAGDLVVIGVDRAFGRELPCNAIAVSFTTVSAASFGRTAAHLLSSSRTDRFHIAIRTERRCAGYLGVSADCDITACHCFRRSIISEQPDREFTRGKMIHVKKQRVESGIREQCLIQARAPFIVKPRHAQSRPQ